MHDRPRVLSVCCGMGLLDRAFLDAGFDVVAGCEIDPDQRGLYHQLCGGQVLVEDIADLPNAIAGWRFAGVIGGPPCQSHTRLRAMRRPKFGDLSAAVRAVLDACRWDWFVFENVARVRLGLGERHARLNAMHYGKPHQSRARWFAFAGVEPPAPKYGGDVDTLMAYSVVAGRIYGPKRGAVLQGYPKSAELNAPCVVLQKGLANAVHYGLGRAWAGQAMAAVRDAVNHTQTA